jgi:hypothetical protein
MNNELEKTWNKVVVADFKVLSQHAPGGTAEKEGKPQS